MRRQLQEDLVLSVNSLEPGYTGHEELDIPDECVEAFYDDVSGKMLPAKLVKKARQEESEFLRSFPVYVKVPEKEAKGKTRVSVRWCDVNKGDLEAMEIRSRLVGREFKWKDPFMQGTFASTPPLESLRYIFHWVQTIKHRRGKRVRIKLLVLDVSRAHFHPPAVREVYITLPPEDFEPGMVGKLLRTIYGTRDAGNQWDVFFNSAAEDLGFEPGESCPCVYRHKSSLSVAWRHGDDVLIAGEETFLREVYHGFSQVMILKWRALLGFENGDDTHVTILNRHVDFLLIDGVECIQ